MSISKAVQFAYSQSLMDLIAALAEEMRGRTHLVVDTWTLKKVDRFELATGRIRLGGRKMQLEHCRE
jgi:hypothetical protein